jgi:Flp pilus assembly CpaE family ATPase
MTAMDADNTAKPNVLLVTKDGATAETVRSALSSSQHAALASVCKDVSQIDSHLSRTAARAVLVDIDPDPSRILYDLRPVVSAHVQSCFVALSSTVNEKLILEAMQAGARHFLRKQSVPAELDEVLEGLLYAGAKEGTKLGDVISIFSSGGGCGTTTVTVNLANELRLASAKRVLAIDLDDYYGTLSSYLGIAGRYGIADVLQDEQRIDKHLIETSAYSYLKDFDVLLSPASVRRNGATSVQYQNLTEALQACREVYRYTLIDAPRVEQSVAAQLAAVSKFSLVVFQLTVKDLKVARELVSFLVESGVARDRIIPVANRVRKRASLVRLEDSKRAIGLNCLYQIRSNWQRAMKALNHGQPLAQVARGSRLRRDFKDLAARIHTAAINGDGKPR